MSEDLRQRIQWANEEIVNKGNLKVVRDLFAPDYVAHVGGQAFRGPEFIESFVTQLRTAFPDLRVDVEPLAVEGDRIAWQRTNRGTHTGEFMGVAPSSRDLTWRDMVVTRFAHGKIAEEWAVSDLSGQLSFS